MAMELLSSPAILANSSEVMAFAFANSAALAVIASFEMEVVKTPSAAIALDSSAATSATLSNIS